MPGPASDGSNVDKLVFTPLPDQNPPTGLAFETSEIIPSFSQKADVAKLIVTTGSDTTVILVVIVLSHPEILVRLLT